MRSGKVVKSNEHEFWGFTVEFVVMRYHSPQGEFVRGAQGGIKNASSEALSTSVFNTSQSTRSGLSLNAISLHTGRKLQTDITAVLTHWRFFKIVFSADIVKMFGQFRLHEKDTDWLRILWRASSNEKLGSYRMLTVVYGTVCDQFQVIRDL